MIERMIAAYDSIWDAETEAGTTEPQVTERKAMRAAIAAMREPTEAMLWATKSVPYPSTLKDDWRAMIDAVLKEET